jgi:hypothetical protein
VSDLSPLEGMPLIELECAGTKVNNLSPLKGMPLVAYDGPFVPSRDAEILRSIPTLARIDGKPRWLQLAEAAPKSGVTDEWVREVQAMPAVKQVEAVTKKLQELNSGFDGKVWSRIEGGVVINLGMDSWLVTDISPVRALVGLKRLQMANGTNGGLITNLESLRGLKLNHLHCGGNLRLSDLSALKGMPLTNLIIDRTKVTDLALLKSMPLVNYEGPFDARRDTEILLAIPTLARINGNPKRDVLGK